MSLLAAWRWGAPEWPAVTPTADRPADPTVGPGRGPTDRVGGVGSGRPGAVDPADRVGGAGAGQGGSVSVGGRRLVVRRRRRQPVRRPRRVYVRLTDAEYADLTEAARRAGLTPAGYAGLAALAAARGREAPGSPVREVLAGLDAATTVLNQVNGNLNKLFALTASGHQVPTGQLGAALEVVPRVAARVDAAAAVVFRRVR